jgi:phosphoserine phosphatase RsbU/P
MKKNAGSPSKSELKDRLILVLSALGDLGETLVESPEFDQSARYLLRLVLGTVGAGGGIFFSYDSSREILMLETSTIASLKPGTTLDFGLEQAKIFGCNPDPIHLSELPRSVQGSLMQFVDLMEIPDCHMIAPLVIRDRLLGLICLGKRFGAEKYDPLDIEILRVLSHHLSISIFNQLLLREMRQANYKLNRKIIEMEHIADIGLAITHLATFGELSREILMKAAAILDARYAALYIRNLDNYQLAASFGDPLEIEGPN